MPRNRQMPSRDFNLRLGGGSSAIKSAGSQIVADYLNPFSEARHASYAKQANALLGEAISET
jgi:hypothetical protein